MSVLMAVRLGEYRFYLQLKDTIGLITEGQMDVDMDLRQIICVKLFLV